MTDKELQKIKDSLPKWDEQNEEEKKLDNELSCREMINSILIYGYLNNTVDEIYENKYLRGYKKDISEERIKELIKEQQEDLKKSKINQDVYTDSEGVTYNSVSWYDDEEQENKKEESYVVNQKYKDMFIDYCKDKIIEVPEVIKCIDEDGEELEFNTLEDCDVYMYEDDIYTILVDDEEYQVTKSGELVKKDMNMESFAYRTAGLDFIGISEHTYNETLQLWVETDSVTEELNFAFEEKYGKVEESKVSEQNLSFEKIIDLANYIAKHYEEITNTPLKAIFNNSEDEPIFNQDIIDKDWEKIEVFINKYGNEFKRDDLLDEIDDALINEKHIQGLNESKNTNSDITYRIKTESLGDRYQVWQKYFEDEEPAKAEYVQSFNSYEEASKFAEGLNKDPNCDAWVIDKSKNESKEFMDKTNFKQYVLKLFTEKIASQINAEEYNSNTGELTKICRNEEILPAYYQYRPYDNIDNDKEYGIPNYVINDIVGGLNFKRGSGSNYYNNYYNKKYGYSFIVNVSIKTTSHDIDGYVYGQVSIKNIHIKEDLNKLDESKELRKYNSRLYGVYDTEKQEYTDTGTLEDMKNEVENNKDDAEETQEEPKEDKKDININITVKNETKEVKIEDLEKESISPIINPEDRYYKDNHLFEVLLYPGAGAELIPYYVYADYEQDALEILLPYLEENAPGLVINIEDLEDEELDDYITVDGIHYLDYNTYIEELDGEEKEKIETEFFKNYKEEE